MTVQIRVKLEESRASPQEKVRGINGVKRRSESSSRFRMVSTQAEGLSLGLLPT